MSINRYHGLCQKNQGRPVQIRTNSGEIHRGIIRHVTKDRVYLQPLGRRANLGGYGYGYRGYRGYGYGSGWGVALAAIAAFAFLPLFFW
ncbi:hypothetical protein [Aquibacillus kalidii]|uniref:hypothetical protein n=1 Tax=Aquibacillus kalidii TaxID=2762597 RepID=UPI001646B989|nr:hypothetical protein [Aquibacillus kalidii]